MALLRSLPLLLLLAAAGAAAQDWSAAAPVEVGLSNFKFSPRAVHLRAGAPVRLHIVNGSEGGHSFTAPEFFAAASVRPEDRGIVREGGIEVPGGQSRDVSLVPAAGRYKLKCDRGMHKMMGMSGEIVVD